MQKTRLAPPSLDYTRSVRRLLVVLAVAAAATAGCGGDAPVGGDGLDGVLRYLPADTGAVVVSTDVESEQFRTFDEKVVRPLGEGSTEDELAGRPRARDSRSRRT